MPRTSKKPKPNDPFQHIGFGGAEILREISFTSYNGLFVPGNDKLLRSFLNDIELRDLILKGKNSEPDPKNAEAPKTSFTLAGSFFKVTGRVPTSIHIHSNLTEGFNGKRAADPSLRLLANDIERHMEYFQRFTGYPSFTAHLNIALPSEGTCWKGVEEADLFGFKTYIGSGPVIRENSTITNWNPPENNFGDPMNDGLEDTYKKQIGESCFGICKGLDHTGPDDPPLIFSRPKLETKFRMSLVLRPTSKREIPAENDLSNRLLFPSYKPAKLRASTPEPG